MTITVPQLSFAGGEWAPALFGRVDLAKYVNALKTCRNFTVHPHGGASNRGGTQFVAEVKDSTKTVRLVPFQFSVQQSYVLEFGDEYMRVIKDGGLVEDSGSPYEIETPYAAADLPLLKWTQSADVMYLTHPSYPVYKLSRTGHAAWTLAAVTFGPSLSAPSSLGRSGSLTGSRESFVVTAVTPDGEESVASTAYDVGSGETLTWGAVTGASYYHIYKRLNGADGFVARAATNSWVWASITPDWDTSTPVANNPFGSSNNYPGCCTFFEQRLLFGRTNTDPQTIWGSVVGNFQNLNKSSPLRDDDSYEFTINSLQVNEIKAMIPLNELIVLTAGTEWKLGPGGQSDAITPTSVQLRMQSKWGVSDVPPLLVGNTVLYVQAAGNVVRDLLYSLEVDGYTGSNLSLLASHLFSDYSITEWTYQQNPDSVVWAVRDDGVLLGMTYQREHEVWAWHRHDTDGEFENVCSIQTGTSFDEVYVVVKRTVDGAAVRYIERFMPRMPGKDIEQAYFVDCGLSLDSPVTITGVTKANPAVVTAAGHGFSNGDYVDIRDVGGMVELTQDSEGNDLPYRRFKAANVTTDTFSLQTTNGAAVDSSEYSDYTEGGTVRKAVTTLSGLDHLEGKTLVAMVNGSVAKNLVVASGAVTIPRGSIVHIGLPYTCDLETLELNVGAEGGTLQDRHRDIPTVVVRLADSRSFWAGPNEDRLLEQVFRQYENYDSPISLFTGDKELSIHSGEERSARVFLRVEDPVPLTVLSVLPRIIYGDY